MPGECVINESTALPGTEIAPEKLMFGSWKTILSFWEGLVFERLCYVSFREGRICVDKVCEIEIVYLAYLARLYGLWMQLNWQKLMGILKPFIT